MTEPVIQVEKAGKRYVKYEDTPMLVTRVARLHTRTTRAALWAIRDVNFDVHAGEVLGIIGRNGSGKSTLLRMLAGVTSPTEGRVRVRGRVAPLIAVGVGFHRELTGRENVYVNGTILGLSRQEIDRRFDEIVEFSELADFIDTPVKFYSSGMYVRLGFAVSVLSDPDVLLVDEVLAVGDIAFQLKCLDRMAELRDRGTTIVLVSHNLNAVRTLCPRTIVAHDGEVRYDGDTAEAMSVYHDLLGEAREVEEGQSQMPRFDQDFRAAATFDRFELLDSEGRRTRSVAANDLMTFEAALTFTERVESPIVGFNVTSSAGVQVYGETTSWSSGEVYEAGDRVDVSVQLRLMVASGSYTCNVGLADPTGAVLAAPPQPVLVYVTGRNEVRGVADLGAQFGVRRADERRPPDERNDPETLDNPALSE